MVEKVIVTEAYDLKIFLSDEIIIEYFAYKLRHENWRFLKENQERSTWLLLVAKIV